VHTLDLEDFEWDREKAAANLAKHGVGFAEAVDAVSDPYAVTREDPDSNGELRYVSLGMGPEGDVLVTVLTFRGERVRIISCRRASAAERRIYRRR
jgi:uncharacterized DUF497 family protein